MPPTVADAFHDPIVQRPCSAVVYTTKFETSLFPPSKPGTALPHANHNHSNIVSTLCCCQFSADNIFRSHVSNTPSPVSHCLPSGSVTYPSFTPSNHFILFRNHLATADGHELVTAVQTLLLGVPCAADLSRRPSAIIMPRHWSLLVPWTKSLRFMQ